MYMHMYSRACNQTRTKFKNKQKAYNYHSASNSCVLHAYAIANLLCTWIFSIIISCCCVCSVHVATICMIISVYKHVLVSGLGATR